MANNEPRTGRKIATTMATLARTVNPPRTPARSAATTPRDHSARTEGVKLVETRLVTRSV